MSANRLASSLLELAREHLLRESGAEGAGDSRLTTPFSTITQSDWAEAVRLWNLHGRPRIAALPARRCPACDGDRHRGLFESYDGYAFVECLACGCWYVPKAVDAAVFEAFFAECPEAREVARRTLEKRSSPENAKADEERIGGNLDAVLPLLPAGAARRYLDVGCGVGVSLRVAAGRGMTATGTESAVECIEQGRREGLDIRHASEMPQAGPFDVVSFWESLEHLADPAAVLRGARDVLAETGLVAFTVPNQHSPLVRAQRGDCSFVNGGYDTAGHINLFGPDNLARLMDRSGLALLDLDGQYGLSLQELVSYLAGRSRGAADLLSGTPVEGGLPRTVTEVLEAVGPAVTYAERLALMSPIVFGIACRKEAAERFREPVEAFRQERRARLIAGIEATMPPPGTYEQLKQRLEATERELAEVRTRLADSEAEIREVRRVAKALRHPVDTLRRLLRRD